MKQRILKSVAWCAALAVTAGVVVLCVAAVNAKHESASDATQPETYKVDRDVIEVAEDAAKHAGIQEMAVEARDVPLTLTLTGRTGLNAETVTHVHAQFGGKVINVGPQLGASVKGPEAPDGPTVLCVIESNDLAQAKANWIQAEVTLKLDEENLSRTRELVKSTVLAPKFLIDAESAVTKDRAALEATRQQLLIFGLSQQEIEQVDKQVGRQRMDYVITSPRSGVVAEKGVAGGEVADPSINLFTVADTSTIWVWGDVYERDLRWVHVGEPVKVFFTSEPDRPRQCRIEWISPALDPNTHSIRVRATLDNKDGHLLADMYGTMVVTVEPGRQSIVVPSDAIVRHDEQASAFVRVGQKGGRIAYQCTPVTIEPVGVGFGASGAAAASAAAGTASRDPAQVNSIRITSGIKPGDVIVQSGALGLYNEMQEQAKNH